MQGPVNTTSPGGQLIFQIFCALAEHECNGLVQGTPTVKQLYEAGQQSTR
ncbi:hypothetical protein [Hymenobacter bucti]|uniref:Uncharacterized protein n=1 Tax=Hymenobacter bucti TaxID=1844114 RepID=A0ABW4R1B0_9BACT